MKKNNYSLNDLPHFSPWPARLLGIEPCEQRYKTPEEITREYNYEKWGTLLNRVIGSKEVSIEDVERWVLEDTPVSLCSVEDEFELLSTIEASRRHAELMENIIKSYLPATALVELGAGYGNIILGLAKKEPFKKMSLIAGEYTASGVELITQLAQIQKIHIQAEHCDFFSDSVLDFTIPEDALIYTSFAAHYVPKLSNNFIRSLSEFHPKAVIHAEPCYEHFNRLTLLGLLRRRYMEVNDYNTNLVTLLHDQQDKGLIKILEERPAVFGMNPLLPASLLVWTPIFKS
ncbi:MAG TPA: hypothetical protein VKL21_08740 [Candidatus Methanoperedens sp.]|nr:hypothetical protein [Candidatus Methanoperedens sp.]